MATVDENYHYWNHSCDWDKHCGEAWSIRWGGSRAQWRHSIFPRVSAYLPAENMLEIAPGYGRWTEYLLPHCERYYGVDLSERCIHACKSRFAAEKAQFWVNDGRSLSALEAASVDFCFSFESLVHAEADVMADYFDELARVLSDGGAAFLHHSNLGEFAVYFERLERWPAKLVDELAHRGLLDARQWRAALTAGQVRELAQKAGLCCVSQELVPWGTRRLIDCFTVVSKRKGPSSPKVLRNLDFMAEVEASARFAQLYINSI